MSDVKYLCTGAGCGIKGDCGHWEGNNNCPEDCVGYAYYVKPPFVGGSCAEYEHIFRRAKEKDDGGC
jgi:hypothetical protein